MSEIYKVFDDGGLTALTEHMKTTRTKANTNETAITTLGEDLAELSSEVVTALGNKQDKLTFDSTPTADSTNPVTSKGVKTALDGKADAGHTHDDRYYTETEVDNKLSSKADSSHSHDYDDLTNKPFYDGRTERSIYVPSSSCPNANILNETNGYYYGTTTHSSPGLTYGATYRVSGNYCDGYCVARRVRDANYWTYSILGNPAMSVAYGNFVMSDGSALIDTGEDWCFMVTSRTTRNVICSKTVNSSITSFWEVSGELVQIDEKYIPDVYAAKDHAHDEYALADHTHDFSELTVTDTTAAKTALDVDDGMICVNLKMDPLNDWDSVAYGDGKFVAIPLHGGENGAYSEDGIVWTPIEMPSLPYNKEVILYAFDKFIILPSGNSAYSTYHYAYSEDGMVWTSVALDNVLGTATSWAYGNGLLLVTTNNDVTGGRRYFYTSDGVNWSSSYFQGINYTHLDECLDTWTIAYGNGRFVVVDGYAGNIMYSEDGLNWVAASNSIGLQGIGNPVYGDGKFIVSYNNMIYYSTDGDSWASQESGVNKDINNIIYANNKFVGVAYFDDHTSPSSPAYSDDGLTWTLSTFPSELHYVNVWCYGGDKFIALVDLQTEGCGLGAFSFDGITWKNELKQITQAGEDVTAKTLEVLKHAHSASDVTFTDGDTFQDKLDAGELTGPKGDTGAAGPQGAKGDKGDTGAQGPKGDTGAAGAQGAKGDKGDTGAAGAQGVSVSSITQTTTSTADAGSNVMTVTLSNGNTSTFTVRNGSKGSTGATGPQGPKGDKGDTGATGPQGAAGADGAKGDKGDTGNGFEQVTTAGDGAAYTATVSGITSLTKGASFTMIPHTASTSATATLNVNGLGAKRLRRPISANNTTSVAPTTTSWLTANKPVRVMYNGTYWLVMDMVRPYGPDLYGTVSMDNLPITTEAWTFELEDGSTVTKNVAVSS